MNVRLIMLFIVLVFSPIIKANNLGEPGVRVYYQVVDPTLLPGMDKIAIGNPPPSIQVIAWALHIDAIKFDVEVRYLVEGFLRGEQGTLRRVTRKADTSDLYNNNLFVNITVDPEKGARVSAHRVKVLSIRVVQTLGDDEFLIGEGI